jgi:DNA-binding beta-propeller fold protein YncE
MLRLLTASVLVLVGCTSVSTDTSPARPPGEGANRAVVYTLLGDGHLLVASLEDGSIIADLDLVRSPRVEMTYRHVIALAPDRGAVYVLVQDAGLRAWIVAVDPATHQILRTLEVGTGADYRGLAVGARSGSLFVFGNEDGAASIWIVDPSGLRPVRRAAARSADGGP